MSLFPAQRRHLQRQSNAVLTAVEHLQDDLGRAVTEDEIQAETWLPTEVMTARLKWLEGRGKVKRKDDGWALADCPHGPDR